MTGPDLVKDGKWPEVWQLDRAPYYLETSVPRVFAAGDVRHGFSSLFSTFPTPSPTDMAQSPDRSPFVASEAVFTHHEREPLGFAACRFDVCPRMW
jgi:hypothetical protein